MAKTEARERSESTQVSDVPTVAGVKLLHTLEGHTSWIGRIAWSPDGKWLASPSGDGTIRLWSADNGQFIRSLIGHQKPVTSVAFNSTSSTLASASDDGTISQWSVPSGRKLRSILVSPISAVKSVAFAPTGSRLAGAAFHEPIKLWSLKNENIIRALRESTGRVLCLAFDRQGRTLASASDDNDIKIWDPDTGELRSTLTGHLGTVYSVAFAPTGGLLASASRDGTVKLWDTKRGKLLSTFEGHSGPVSCAAFLSSGQLLASRGDDAVRLWNAATGGCVGVIPVLRSSQWQPGLAFHPHEPRLATVALHHGEFQQNERPSSIFIWSLDPATLLSKETGGPVSYTSAKVVLVGESNAGKSYLAHRIATGRAPRTGEIQSTHGMKFWPLEPEKLCPSASGPAGQRRDLVLWDMGGQEEYRLIHQLFLHDTTIAMILFDPTRGNAAFKEVETWNKYLEKQLQGRQAAKILVGAKQDQSSNIIDRTALDRLKQEGGFSAYYETSAINGRGIAELCEGLASVIDWEALGKTSRPELFQRIRDEIESRRAKGDVVLHIADLHRALSEHPPTDDEAQAVDAVTEQLAAQGIIARSRVATGERVLVLQVQEIERYGGSMITAARNNPRGVPALELKAIAAPGFELPGLVASERLPRREELLVLECTVQLLLEHGLCFQHEGLLIFPSLFSPASLATETPPEHTVSLYYDFSGAIDNIYASLIAWLVLAHDFGRIRLWTDRAEFEVRECGLCGVCKVGRPGGFARVDVYFEVATPHAQRGLFISFVEEHLRQHGVEIREHIAVTCLQCREQISEEVIRKRIARGEKDVVCQVCETRNSLAEGATASRDRDPQLTERTWALKTSVAEGRRKATHDAIQIMTGVPQAMPKEDPIRALHLSDLHFRAGSSVDARLQALVDDLRDSQSFGPRGIEHLDYLIISGDFTDRGNPEGHEQALTFVSELAKEFGLSAERCVFVPGNHDVRDLEEAYTWKPSAAGLKDGQYVKQGDVYLVPNSERYPDRLRSFSDNFYHKFVQKQYPLNTPNQGIAIPFWETGIQFLTLNSSWQIDQFNRKRASIHEDAVAHVLRMAQQQDKEARNSGRREANAPLLRIAVWHHAVSGPEQMRNTDFLSNLQKSGVRLALHGDLHEMKRALVGHWDAKNLLHIIGAGSFGAPASDRPESTPRLYNLLEIRRDLTGLRVHTRCQPRAMGAWQGWNEWPRPQGGDGAVPYYDISW